LKKRGPIREILSVLRPCSATQSLLKFVKLSSEPQLSLKLVGRCKSVINEILLNNLYLERHKVSIDFRP
jgi:hypothetical protein